MVDHVTAQAGPPGPALKSRVRPNKWWMLAAVSVATFMLLLDVTVVNVALPDIQQSLDSSFFDLQWVIDAYALTLAVFLLAAGALADQLGRRRVFVVGLAIFTVSSLLCGVAASPLMLNLARGVEGIGGAVMYAVAPALIANDFHGKQRAVAFGISGGVTGLAVAIGPLLGGALTAVSWRWIFLLNVPIGVLVAAVMLTRVAESRDPVRRRIDWPGLAVFSVALTMLVFALIRGEAQGWTDPLILGLFAGAGVLLPVFVLIERKRRDPMLDLGLFRIRSFNGLAIATVAANAALMTAILFQVLYMQYVLGFSAYGTGLRYLPLTLAVFVAAAVSGTLADRIPARLMVGIGCVALGGGMLAADSVTAASPWTDLLPGMLLAGFGMGVFNPVRAAAAVALVPVSKAGMSSGMSETFQQGGVVLGVAALGSVAHSRMTEDFSAAVTASGQFSGDAADRLAEMVSAGRLTEVAGAVPPEQRALVAATANDAFVAGMDLVMRVGGIVAIVGGLLGFALMRQRDFPKDPSAPDQDRDQPAVQVPAH
ncbi:MFS transporter [Streptomyces phaeochromogenes]|uniref:MFS transporter n=1 Tax=Streptomyces phaeochromogenes TaxID=1923 RepID=UPI002E2B7BD1|nr:MFS transporter [Streptomyces phaeochromogenes]